MIGRRHAVGLVAAFCIMSGISHAADGGVLVFGGTRETGLEIVKTLVAKGDQVTVMVRPTSDLTELKKLKVSLVTGDALKFDDVKAAFASAKFRAAVSSLGGQRGEPRPDYEGVKNVVDAAKAAGVKRMVLVTAIGVGDSRAAVSEATHKMLGAVFAEKVKSEDYLKASGLTYTIVRPGGLRSGIPTGKAVFTEDKTVGSDIYREDLGAITANAVDDAKTFNKVFSAIDPSMMDAGPMEPRPGSPTTPIVP